MLSPPFVCALVLLGSGIAGQHVWDHFSVIGKAEMCILHCSFGAVCNLDLLNAIDVTGIWSHAGCIFLCTYGRSHLDVFGKAAVCLCMVTTLCWDR